MTIEIFEDRIEFGNGNIISEISDNSGLIVNSNFYAKKNKYKTQAQGTVSGYSSGGWGSEPTPSASRTTIDKFPFSADFITATGVGDLTQARLGSSGQSSTESGYTSGGRLDFQPSPTANMVDTVDKFPFSADANATDVGNLSQIRGYLAGNSSTENGYTSGGNTPVSGVTTYVSTIEKFPFSVDGDASGIGNLTQARTQPAGQSSFTHGYNSGGAISPGSPPIVNTIDKFTFATDADATDVGDLTQARYSVAAQSSGTHGYSSGGATPSLQWTIDKFPFSSDADATDVGDIKTGIGTSKRIGRMAGQSSETYGYHSGGIYGGFGVTDIGKFSFSYDANSAGAGDLTQGRYNLSGQQV